ncbi:hypothetical protein DRB96_42405 [Streptomyces sp. ICC1]|nr:hypothetical protein DRB96_42405 [Streptomyces sp. ICC1]
MDGLVLPEFGEVRDLCGEAFGSGAALGAGEGAGVEVVGYRLVFGLACRGVAGVADDEDGFHVAEARDHLGDAEVAGVVLDVHFTLLAAEARPQDGDLVAVLQGDALAVQPGGDGGVPLRVGTDVPALAELCAEIGAEILADALRGVSYTELVPLVELDREGTRFGLHVHCLEPLGGLDELGSLVFARSDGDLLEPHGRRGEDDPMVPDP